MALPYSYPTATKTIGDLYGTPDGQFHLGLAARYPITQANIEKAHTTLRTAPIGSAAYLGAQATLAVAGAPQDPTVAGLLAQQAARQQVAAAMEQQITAAKAAKVNANEKEEAALKAQLAEENAKRRALGNALIAYKKSAQEYAGRPWYRRALNAITGAQEPIAPNNVNAFLKEQAAQEQMLKEEQDERNAAGAGAGGQKPQRRGSFGGGRRRIKTRKSKSKRTNKLKGTSKRK